MSSATENQYQPDSISPPGEVLSEKLGEIGMSQAQLAERIGRPKKTVNEIIKGKAAVLPETALQLERVLGIPARFWNNSERQYREFLAGQAEQERLRTRLEWLTQVPVGAMERLGWLPSSKDPIERLRNVLNFYGAASPESLLRIARQKDLAFRQSTVRRVAQYGTLAWIRKGELEAQCFACAPYDEKRFREALRQVRRLTQEPAEVFEPRVRQLCAEAGVAVVFVPELPGIRTWGATEWLGAEKAMIQLSLRYKTDDHLWFTFFHEAAHILLHPKRAIFLELDGGLDRREDEANRFAADFLVPVPAFHLAQRKRLRSRLDISMFARQIGVAPGIVVGRLQREGLLPWSHLNGLKRRLCFKRRQQ